MSGAHTDGPHCRGCGAPVAVWAARPRIDADGVVSLWCRACPDTAALSAPPPVAMELARALGGAVRLPSPSAARGPRRWTASAALVLVAVGGAFYAESSIGDGDAGERIASPAIPGRVAPGHEPVRPGARVSSLGVMLDGEPIEDRFPTLAAWVHPVLGTGEPLPTTGTRRFGAPRPGKRPPECGGGHCGVDLSGDRGTPIVAVAPGVVVQVKRDSSGRGGRFVRVRHPDDTVSSYFHLDEVAEDLAAGQEIEAGRRLGTLGSSGVQVSGPHLHFGIGYADGARTVHLDPLPFLRRAMILPVDEDHDAQRQAAAQD